jgi:hypothetical protein
VHGLRADTGSPHWLIIDEAHHLFPPAAAHEVVELGETGVCLITNEPESVAPEVLGLARHVFSTSIEAVTETRPLVPRAAIPGGALETGEALSIPLHEGADRRVVRFRVARRETSHKRHVRKYATEQAPARALLPFPRTARSAGPGGAKPQTFTMLAKGVSTRTPGCTTCATARSGAGCASRSG